MSSGISSRAISSGWEVPYPTGTWLEIKIFLNSLVGYYYYCLPGKCVEADNGYMGHPDKDQVPQQ
jgi:hypothetical protein